jgi:hypothetical protein
VRSKPLADSYGSRVGDRVIMLDAGGEWAEGEISKVKRDFETLREEVELLKMDKPTLGGAGQG